MATSRQLNPSRNPILRPPSYRQRLFVEHYLGESSGSAVDAARRAGYQWPEKLGPRLAEKSREKWSSGSHQQELATEPRTGHALNLGDVGRLEGLQCTAFNAD